MKNNSLNRPHKAFTYTVIVITIICPVLEYDAPVWHHLINRTQAQQLESIQKRVIHIIFNVTHDMSYHNILFVAELELLETRRSNISRAFLPSYPISARYRCYHAPDSDLPLAPFPKIRFRRQNMLFIYKFSRTS